MEKYQTLKDLVKFNTIKDKENNQIIDYIQNKLKKIGFKTEYKTKVLIMSIGDNPKLGFLGHTDTVEYIEEFKNPFDIRFEGENIYGLGVCDMKGGIAAMLDAVESIDFSKLNNGMKLYFTFDEEIGFGGINEIVSNKEIFPEYIIFGEPTDNELLVGHKGLLEYKIVFKGIKVHSSNPEKGKSANLNAVKFLYELDEFYNKNIKGDKEEGFEIPYTTMNVGIINGGSAANSIPAKCTITLDFRVAKCEHIVTIKNKIDELCKKFDAEAEIVEEVEAFIDKIDFIKDTKTANFMTEAGKISGSKRIILGTGPVTAHEVNEHISKESYNKLIEQYKELIYNICS